MEQQTNQTKDFQAPRHWMGTEELNANYWNDEATQTRRAQEFYDKPIETLETIEKMDKSGISRRDFLTVMGASMAMATFACARRPVNKIIPYVVQPQELTPGVPLYYASTCRECSKNCGLLVKTREGRPIKLEGNDLHPMNQGSLCTQGQASVLDLYDPDRLKGPVQGSKGSSKNSTSWSDLDGATAAALKSARHVRVISYPQSGPSVRRAMKEFLSAFADGQWFEVDPLAENDLADAQEQSFGSRVIPQYYFDQAEVIVSVGADFLGAWGSIENQIQWAKRRKLLSKNDPFSKVYVAEGMLTTTGASADERLAILPGTELALLTAIAQELIVHQKKSKFAGAADVAQTLNTTSMEQLLTRCGGIDREMVRKIVNDLWAAKGKSLVVASGSVAASVVANLINSALENEGATIDGLNEATEWTANTKKLGQLISEMESGAVDVVIIHQLNPVYFMPNGTRFAEALAKVKTVIAVNDRVDESALFADYVVAENHSLESWGDAHSKGSVISLQQPTISPIADTRSMEDQFLAWARAGVKVTGLLAQTAANPSATAYDYVKENWKQSLYPPHGKGQTFNDFWENTLQTGVLNLGKSSPRARNFSTRGLNIVSLELRNESVPSLTISKRGPVTEGAGLMLALYEPMGLGDGRNANNAWLQEMPDPISSLTWDNSLSIGVALAADLSLETNDVVAIHAKNGATLEVPVIVQPGLAKGAIALSVGYGRTAVGSVGNGVGVNAYRLAGFDFEHGHQLTGIETTISKTGRRYELAITHGHHRTGGRPVINDITYPEYKQNEAAHIETNPEVRLEKVPTMWTEPVDYSKSTYRWGMAVDINACTGCGACIIACQAENNVPVVGRDRVRMSREMHWIKIDRYYSGSEEQPKVLFQPMMCQHCENAPCETVCPVLATTHSDEGLNQMTYSRCVGTRYCQNNCPYKVRRFNFFDHWKDYKGTKNMVWNPDVTVRSRGIMEKCTFCIQRINVAKGKAKDNATTIKDGDLKTACQQTCATEAIVFGNINDPKSKVSILHANARAFRDLEILNTKPSISYLTKVRNIEVSAEGEKEHANGQHS